MPNQTRAGDDGRLVTRKQRQILFLWNGTARGHLLALAGSRWLSLSVNAANAEGGGVRLAILMLACFACEMGVFCSPRKDGKRGAL